MDRSEMTAGQLAEDYLRTVAAHAKVGSKGIYESRLLYSFVITARRARLSWTATEVQKRLVEQGVDEEPAKQLGQIYGHCRAALQLAGKGNHNDADWSLFLS